MEPVVEHPGTPADGGRWRVARVSQSESEAARALFAQVFGRAMPAGLWDWKYGDGRGVNLLAWHGDELVGHYGGLTRRIRLAGRPALALQGCDVMVKPSERAVLGRRGPLFLMTSRAMELEVGAGKRHDLLYGFPSARHMRIAERHGLYAPVAWMREMRWATAGVRPSRRLECVALDPRSVDLRLAIASLWPRMLEQLPGAVLVERDADYFDYRFARHPVFEYRIYLVRSRLLRRPVGLFVLKREGEEVEWMDLIAPVADIGRLVPFARRAAAELGGRELLAWACAAHAHRFRPDGAQEKDLQIPIPSQIWTPGIAPGEVLDRWWLMSGDTDFR